MGPLLLLWRKDSGVLKTRKGDPKLSRRGEQTDAQELDNLWRSYKVSKDPVIQNRLAEQYLPLVKSIAMGLSRKMGQNVDVDDMIADGSIGLIRAIDTFDIDRGFKFQTYATTVVRGAILNGMRRMDWVPERVRAKNRQLQQAIDRHQAESGEAPSHEELAEELKLSTEEVYDLIANMGTAYLLSLEQPLGGEESDANLGDMVDDDDDVPDIEFEYAEERDALRNAIGKLDEREQLIVTAHYFEGVTFDAISKILGVSKQRISQMHTRAMQRLRQALGDQEISSEAMQGFTFESSA